MRDFIEEHVAQLGCDRTTFAFALLMMRRPITGFSGYPNKLWRSMSMSM